MKAKHVRMADCHPDRPHYSKGKCKKCGARSEHLAKNYGISTEDYEILLKLQGLACGLCGSPHGDRALDIDRCFSTGKLRGLLCRRCNYALFQFDKDPDKLQTAIAYLKK